MKFKAPHVVSNEAIRGSEVLVLMLMYWINARDSGIKMYIPIHSSLTE